MLKSFLVLLAVAGAAQPAFASTPMIVTDTMTNKVLVLKHAEKGVAFVRTTDSERITQLVDGEGYGVVSHRNEMTGAVEPVVADIVPAEEAAAENLEASRVAEVMTSSGRPRDNLDIGLGLNIGLTTGLKARILATIGPGVVVGLDIDVGTVLFISDATLSAVLGYSFEAGRHVIRPYVTVGGGGAVLFAIIAAAEARVFHAGAGVEWKPVKWFGLGLEGGVNVYTITSTGSSNGSSGTIPYARLNVMFYFR